MTVIDGYILGFSNILTLQYFLAVLIGVIMGIIFGAVPGITTAMGMTFVLPITFTMELLPALGLLLGMYIGGITGGHLSAILLNIPGNPASIATTLDGHPMARRGEAPRALGIALLCSFIGGMFSLVILFTFSPLLARVALMAGPIEYFSITLVSLLLISSLSGKSLRRGIIAGCFGIALTTIGSSPIDGGFRYTFGIPALTGGLSLIPVLIGVFAITEILDTAELKLPMIKPREYKLRGFGLTLQEFKSQIGNIIRSALIGTGIGVLPAIGGNVSALLAYSATKNRSKTPEKFGTGHIEGLVAPEVANNAGTGGAMVPLLTLGIPGDAPTAVLMVALMIHGVQPGPLLFSRNAEIVYTIFAFLIMANILMLVSEYYGMRLFLRVLAVPKHILMPVILVFCVVGAFSVNSRLFDVGSVIVIGLLAYGMKKFDYPHAPFILGFVLGGMFETNLRRALIFTRGDVLEFFRRPVSAVAFIIFILVIVLTIRAEIKAQKKSATTKT